MAALSKYSLNVGERNRVLKALREAGIKPPRVGYCVTAFGGEVCRHPPNKIYNKRDTGYQVIRVDAAAAKLGAARRRR